MHEIELERNFIKDSLNWTKSEKNPQIVDKSMNLATLNLYTMQQY